MQRLAAKGKGILLLHDIQPRTVAALPKILHDLKARGYRIVHVVPATPENPATPTEPQQWRLHPPSENWSRPRAGQKFRVSFSRSTTLLPRAAADQFLLERRQAAGSPAGARRAAFRCRARRRGRGRWRLASNDAASALPVPAAARVRRRGRPGCRDAGRERSAPGASGAVAGRGRGEARAVAAVRRGMRRA